MTVWVDADACPRAILDVLVRAAERRGLAVVLVANRPVVPPRAPCVTAVRVGDAFDAADRHIAENVAAGDLVVTADVPLAAAIVAAGAIGLSPRGDLFTEDNVGEKLAARDLLDELRRAGTVTGGPPPQAAADVRRFADALDRTLTRLASRRQQPRGDEQ